MMSDENEMVVEHLSHFSLALTFSNYLAQLLRSRYESNIVSDDLDNAVAARRASRPPTAEGSCDPRNSDQPLSAAKREERERLSEVSSRSSSVASFLLSAIARLLLGFYTLRADHGTHETRLLAIQVIFF